ncbi:MAG: TonB-dependent receptor [Niabella sp.]
MKLTLLLLTAFLYNASGKAISQNVTYKGKNVTLNKIFESIEQQTGYVVFCEYSLVKNAQPVTIDATAMPLDRFLKNILYKQHLTFVFKDKTIIISGNKAPRPNQSAGNAQIKEIMEPSALLQGDVKNTEGESLAGAAVTNKTTKKSTLADASGRFSIDASAGDVLSVSMVGYDIAEVKVQSNVFLSIVLTQKEKNLNAVVVVGYGTQKKKDLTGAISSVDNTRFQNLPNTNITQALRGSVPGISITAGGNAGSGSAISVRGQNSINGGTNALIVVDGIIYDGEIGNLNSNDIASIDVLKDASSAAIFGSRAANGVILITTKKGTTSKPTVNFNGYTGFQGMLMTQDLETPKQYVDKKINYQKTLAFRGTASYPDTSNPVQYLNAAEVDNYEKGIIVDPLSVITRTAITQSYNLSIGANTGNTNYFVAGNWTDQQGIVLGDQFKRASLRVNLETRVTDWLKFGTNSAFSFVDVSGSQASLLSAIQLSPYGTWYLDSAKTILNPLPMTDGLVSNPLLPTLNKNTSQRKNLFGILYSEISFPFIKGLTYRFTYSNNMISYTNQTFIPAFNAGGLDRVASATSTSEEIQDMYLESLVKYNHTFAGDHQVDLTLLYNYNFATDKATTASANTFPSDVLSYYSLSLGENQSTAASYSDYHGIAMMARLNYKYRDRYLLTVTGRRDGASVFSQNNKFAFFPSMALGWILSEENFLKSNPVINFLKLRFSWGANGNQAISRYQSLSRIETGTGFDYLFGGSTAYGIAATSMGNSDLKWESTYAFNYGIDFELLKSRISGSMNYYNSSTHNLLLNRTIPVLNGFSSVLSNLGSVNNKGIELELNTVNIKTRAVEWRTGLNFAKNKNTIVHLYGTKDENGKETDDISNKWFIGKSLGAYYNYVPYGIWQIGDDIPDGFRAGDVKLRDLNKDGVITADGDRAIIGYNVPDFTFGFNSSLKYKGFTLYMQITGSVGGVRNNQDILDPATNFTYRIHGIYENWWTPKNPSTSNPSMDYQDAYNINWLQSTTWVRIQDISLSYDFPVRIISRLKMKQLQVYLSSKNPFLFTKWGGWDPETTGTGRSQYPTMRSVNFGVNLSL